MKRSYLYLFLTILLFTFNVSALNSNDKNITDNNKTTNEYNMQSQSKKYKTFSFTDAKGVKWKFQQVEPFKVINNVKCNYKIYRNGKYVANGQTLYKNSLSEAMIEFFSFTNTQGGGIPNAKIYFPLGDYYTFTVADNIFFGKDGYVYPSREYQENENRHWRIKYSKQ